MKAWNRIRKYDDQFAILEFGCDCCAASLYHPPYADDCPTITPEDLDVLEEGLTRQLELAKELRTKLLSETERLTL